LNAVLQTSPGAETGDENGLTREYAGGKMLSTKHDGIGVATFNQPEKHNAISVEMWLGLADILEDFESDD
jgi:enoyl-CoA hydratase/carnithine racemase